MLQIPHGSHSFQEVDSVALQSSLSRIFARALDCVHVVRCSGTAPVEQGYLGLFGVWQEQGTVADVALGSACECYACIDCNAAALRLVLLAKTAVHVAPCAASVELRGFMGCALLR
ncbi:hypothetical protein NDU88_005772 [Pleurodeles waltl]|uniref:Uncharacterized protein n=1 Tax=Pleurodeles waltl TaxID=8319 RepID=A0AAV7VNV5_PLEWA|nr:hypothetical protein NDU88_005772 [Pleurodeles waltl]